MPNAGNLAKINHWLGGTTEGGRHTASRDARAAKMRPMPASLCGCVRHVLKQIWAPWLPHANTMPQCHNATCQCRGEWHSFAVGIICMEELVRDTTAQSRGRGHFKKKKKKRSKGSVLMKSTAARTGRRSRCNLEHKLYSVNRYWGISIYANKHKFTQRRDCQSLKLLH